MDIMEWQEQPNTVFIGHQLIWGNPFGVPLFGRTLCLTKYEEYLRGSPTLMGLLPFLRGGGSAWLLLSPSALSRCRPGQRSE